MVFDFQLPEHLASRTEFVQRGDSVPSFVIYWMRTAVRAHENPALEAAVFLANQFQIPLLVYHGLSEHYRYASDRHHTYMLQGAQDVQKQLAERELSYAFHLARPSDRGPHLLTLAEKSGCVVTETMPVGPPKRFLRVLCEKVASTILSVDTACIVPMSCVGKAFTRAFKYRTATQDRYDAAVSRSWPSVDLAARPFPLADLPFEPVDFSRHPIADLVAQCEIDHSVGPVYDTPGGSDAGYQRWNDFKEQGLKLYAKRRNDALSNGVSRMSAYLHYGMVSPFRIAREAAEYDHAGAVKYLDELLTWRELSYAFCFHRDDYDQWSALPTWAQQTLQHHTADSRPEIYSWEQLARGQTNDELWNVAQKSLLMHGELHNNVRMTWGKAILQWTRTPQQALRMIIELNHRYALDGRDPASYGGILWCLGQFDRPFDPEKPILGTVRPRPSAVHAKRLPPADYRRYVARARVDGQPKIAVIGAGLAGMFAARTLSDHGLDVTVFEKSRGPGGRMSTRRVNNELHFDHGAQYFTARDKRFQRYVQAWKQQGVVAHWPDTNSGKGIVVLKDGAVEKESSPQDRWIGVPTMTAICKHLLNSAADQLSIQSETRIQQVCNGGTNVKLIDSAGKSLGVYENVIVATPAEQANDLLQDFPELTRQIQTVTMLPCWATMIAFPDKIPLSWVGAFVHESFLSWIAVNSSKPGRPSKHDGFVLHAQPKWTEKNWDVQPDEIALSMQDEFFRCTGIARQEPTFRIAHRWRYALAEEPSKDCCWSDHTNRVTICGDWLNGSRVEGAFLSGMAAAGRILGSLKATTSDSFGDPEAGQGALF